MDFDCTEEEFRVFENLVMEKEFIGTFPFHLELVLLGVKPGAWPSVYREVENFRDEIREMGLYIKIVEREFVDLENAPRYARDEKWDKGYFVARDPVRFEMLQENYESEEEFDRDFGLFLGYPEDDVEWFINSGGDISAAIENRDEEMLKSLMAYISYVPAPREENVERARNLKQKYVEAVLEADEKFDSSAGRTLLEAIREIEDMEE